MFRFPNGRGSAFQEFALAITENFALYSVHYAVYETTYTPKRHGDSEDLPRYAREGRTWKIYTTLWHAHEGSLLPTAQSHAFDQVYEEDNGVTKEVLIERISRFGEWMDAWNLAHSNCAFVRAVAIAPDSYLSAAPRLAAVTSAHVSRAAAAPPGGARCRTCGPCDRR